VEQFPSEMTATKSWMLLRSVATLAWIRQNNWYFGVLTSAYAGIGFILMEK